MSFKLSVTLVSITTAVAFVSCKNSTVMPSDDLNINYPAAYIVNGEDASVSVIGLSSNNVSATISLMGTGSDMIMWPHHISHHSSGDIHHLAIGVPGMDLSGGHEGGMAGMPGKILVIDGINGNTLNEVDLPVMNHNAVYSPDGTEIWTTQMEEMGKVLVYDAASYTLKATIDVGMMPAEVTFSADRSKAYVCNGMDNSVTIINPSSKAVITTIAVGEDPVGAWVGNDGNMYVDNEKGESISVISVASNTVIQTIDLGFMPGSAAHNNTKKELWVTDPDNSKVHYWTWDSGMNMWMHGGAFVTAAGAHAIAFTSDGNTAYITNQMASSVSVVDVVNHTKTKDILVGKKPNGVVIKE